MNDDLEENFIFPDPNKTDKEGLVAVGGDLSVNCLLSAYGQGIFPWFNPGDPIIWWSPDPRTVLYPEQLYISKSLAKTMRKKVYKTTMDKDFEAVINHCALARSDQAGTWISEEMKTAYIELHKKGFAHSFECWTHSNELVGGLYGIRLGQLFFGESMFSQQRDTSKIAMNSLCQYAIKQGIHFIDCQVENPHLMRMGAQSMPRAEFLNCVKRYTINAESTL